MGNIKIISNSKLLAAGIALVALMTSGVLLIRPVQIRASTGDEPQLFLEANVGNTYLPRQLIVLTATADGGEIFDGPIYSPDHSFEGIASEYQCSALAGIDYEDERGRPVRGYFEAHLALTRIETTPTPPQTPTPVSTPTLKPTSTPAPLKVAIRGATNVVAHCTELYSVVVEGGVAPYTISDGGDDVIFMAFPVGEHTIHRTVTDSIDQSADGNLSVTAHSEGTIIAEINSTMEWEDASDRQRVSNYVNGKGPEPGILAVLYFTESYARTTSISAEVTITLDIGIIEGVLKYSEGETITLGSSHTSGYHVSLPEGQRAYLYAHPVHEITQGTITQLGGASWDGRDNCQAREVGVFIGKKPIAASVYIEIE